MSKTIPMIKGKFLIGSVAELGAEGPEFLYRIAQEHGEIVQFSLFGQQTVLITNPDIIRDVLVTQYDNFPKGEFGEKIMRRFIGNGLVTVSGEAHKKQRKMAQPAFHSRRIQNYAETMVDYTSDMLDEWQSGEWRDVDQEMYKLTMYIVAKTLFDADRNDMAGEADRVGDAIHVGQEVANDDFSSPIQWADWIPTRKNRKRVAARAILHETIDQLIAARQSSGTIEDKGDLLSMLLMAHDEAGEGIDDAQVRDELITMFVAGHETTSNALTWTWYLLSQHPEVEAKLHEELDRVVGLPNGGRMPALSDLPNLPYTLQIFKEALRLYPPAWLLNARQAKENTTVGGYDIPKDTLIFISPYVNHRLPQYFSDPLAFKPERFTPEFEKELPRYAYMPFGGGPRVCIGNSFAQMEAHLILATMAQRYRFELSPTQEIELNALITMSSKHGMKMQVLEREKDSSLLTFSAEKVVV